jgi:enolase
MKIASIKGQEILDSRGNPTVEAQVRLENGESVRAAVPSGASTGVHEALELEDEDKDRYEGKGDLKAQFNIDSLIAPELVGMEATQQQKIDKKLLELDGTENKSRLGANAILAVSMAATKAGAETANKPLYAYIAELFGNNAAEFRMPVPMMNVLNGGKHAPGAADMQEYMLMPTGAPSITEAVRWGAEIFHKLGDLLKQEGFQTTVGDEGGYAPPLKNNEEPLKLIMRAIETAGYKPGEQVVMAMDPAASEFYVKGIYQLKAEGRQLDTEGMIDLYAKWLDKYPIKSIEDPLSEDDWAGFTLMTHKLGDKLQIVGDDLFVTNTKRLQKGIDNRAANAILIKVNQIGTVTETIEAIKLADEHGYRSIISHRSGETEDTFIADLAVGSGAGQIKTGSLSRSDRVAKYNQLMRIEDDLEEKAIYKSPFDNAGKSSTKLLDS